MHRTPVHSTRFFCLLPLAVGLAACDEAAYDFPGEQENIGFSSNLVVNGLDQAWTPSQPVALGTEVEIRAMVRLGKDEEDHLVVLTHASHFDSWADSSGEENPCASDEESVEPRPDLVVYGDADDAIQILSRTKGAGTGARVKHCGQVVLSASEPVTSQLGFSGSDTDRLTIEFAHPSSIDFDIIGTHHDFPTDEESRVNRVVLMSGASAHAIARVRDAEGRTLGYSQDDLQCEDCDPERSSISESSLRIDAGDSAASFRLGETALTGGLDVATVEVEDIVSLEARAVDQTMKTRVLLQHRWSQAARDLDPLFLIALEQGIEPTLEQWDSAWQSEEFWADLASVGICEAVTRHSPPRTKRAQQEWDELCPAQRLFNGDETMSDEVRERFLHSIQRTMEFEDRRPAHLDSSCEFLTPAQAYARLGANALRSVSEIQFEGRVATGEAVVGEVPMFSCDGVVALKQGHYREGLDTGSDDIAPFLQPRFALVPGRESGTVHLQLGTAEASIELRSVDDQPLTLELDARYELLHTIERIHERPEIHDLLPTHEGKGIPRSARALDDRPVRWRGKELRAAMQNPMTLGSYWIERTEDSWIIHGVADLDQDGLPMHVRMAEDEIAEIVSEDGVR